MTAIDSAPYYRPLTAATWRASVAGDGRGLPPWPGEAAEAASWRAWLAQMWATRRLAEAVTQASPPLAQKIEQVFGGREYPVPRLRRMGTSLARYLIRARGRATPFGTFAGVGPVHFGARAQLSWSGDHRLRTRVDAVWLADVIARLEACRPLRERLPVVLNDLLAERGETLVVPWQPHLASAIRSGGEVVAEVTVRSIPVLRTIRQAARTPVPVHALVDKIMAGYPGAARDALADVVGRLVTSGVLISSLRAPGTCADPLGHLLCELDEMGADAVAEVKTLHAELRALHHQLSGLGRAGARAGEEGRRLVSSRMRALSPVTDQPVAVDLHLGATLVLPRVVAVEAAAAAKALIRLTPQPSASASWREFHQDFLARYGPGTLVPVAELTDPARGLGYPRHFIQPAGREVTRRDDALLALAHQAALDRRHEIVLDDADLDGIALTGDGARPVSAADLSADLRAASQAALDEGEFALAVSGFGRFGATTGRFLDLLETSDRNKTTAVYAAFPTGVHGALAAQLSFPPRHLGSENVLRVMPVLPHVISLAEHRHGGAGHIPVTDLAVAADSTRLYLVSRSQRRVIEPMLPHAGARHTMPDLARLLFEIPRSTQPAVTTFDWGIAACLPDLPRVRYGRSILTPAQWRIDPAGLPGLKASEGQWVAAWEKLREVRRLPATVSVGDGDRRLRLDLDQAMDLAVLRSHLDVADGPVTVAEASTGADHGWCGGRVHEIVIPLVPTAPPWPAPSFLTTNPLPVADRQDGAGVVFAKLYGPGQAVNAILARHLPSLLEQWEKLPRWWFVRYGHPRPHLRLRLRDADIQRAAGRVAAWAERLRQAGLAGEVTFDAYHPETGRYGTGAALDAAEALFAADSTAVLAQLAFLATHQEIPPQALTAVSMIDLTGAALGSRPAGLGWLLDHPRYADGAPSQDRRMRSHTLNLARQSALQALAGGSDLAAAWAARAEAAADYTNRLATSGQAPEKVLGSLLHLHHVRAHAPDEADEATTYKLARAVALADAARRADRRHQVGDW